MQTLPRDVNPFALMLDPQAVLTLIAQSERLEHLQRRICRPLDKPVLGAVADDSTDLADSGDLDDSFASEGGPARDDGYRAA